VLDRFFFDIFSGDEDVVGFFGVPGDASTVSVIFSESLSFEKSVASEFHGTSPI
jgi:hypothetical protein